MSSESSRDACCSGWLPPRSRSPFSCSEGAPRGAPRRHVGASARGSSSASRAATGLTPFERYGHRHRRSDPARRSRAYLGIYKPERTRPVSLAALVLIALLGAAIWLRGVDGKPARRGRRRQRSASRVHGRACSATAYAIRYPRVRLRARVAVVGRRSPIPSGGLLLLLPVLLTWASDIGAYAVGRTMGRHKLIPSVSPGKDGRRRAGRSRREHARRVGDTRHSVLQPASHLDFRFAPPVFCIRRPRERRGADRRSRRVAAQARGWREGQLADPSRTRRHSRSVRQPAVRDADRVRVARCHADWAPT